MMFKYKLHTIIFCIYMILTYGFGYYYNNLWRIGNIFPSDIVLAIFYLAFLLAGEINPKIAYKVFSAIIISALMLIWGLLWGAEIGYIFRDLKMFLYFFTPFLYIKHICSSDHSSYKIILTTYGICLLLSIILCWTNLVQNGLNNLDSGTIDRTFSIGMDFSCVIPISLVIRFYWKNLRKKIGSFTLVGIELFCVATVIMSYTRTVWITFFLVHIIATFTLMQNKISARIRISKNSIISNFLLIMILVLVCYALIKNLPELTDTILSRVNSIFISDENNVDTLSYRIKDVSSAFYKFNSPRIIIGYGYGDVRVPYGWRASSVNEEFNVENSYFYYVWKYGIIFSAYLLHCLHCKFKNIWNMGKGGKLCVTYLIIAMAIGSMSGQLNNYYTLAIYAMYLAIMPEMIKRFDTGSDNDEAERYV